MSNETRISTLDLPTIHEMLFPNWFELLPSVTEVFELEFAYYESKILSKHAVIIIESNDIQTGGIRLENKIKEFGKIHGLNLLKK